MIHPEPLENQSHLGPHIDYSLKSQGILQRSILTGSMFNFAAMAVGSLISFIAYPIFLHALGTERFAISSIVGAIISYFLIFDLGLGRASVVILGKKIDAGDKTGIARLFWSGQILMLCFGLLGSLILAGFASYICRNILKVPAPLVFESEWGLALVGLSIPLMIAFSAQLGFLGNLGRFGTMNAARTIMNALSWTLPLIALHFRKDLISALGAMLIARIFSTLVTLFFCVYAEPSLRRMAFATRSELRPMLHQGGWMSITNIVSPLMNNLDRLIIGALANLTMVTYYSVAGDTSQKLWIVQASIIGALFPLLPGLLSSNSKAALSSCHHSSKMLLLVLTPAICMLSVTAPALLKFWIGASIAQHVAIPFFIVLIGVYINSFAHIPFSLLAAAEKSKNAAILHLIEAPIFLLALYLLVKPFGVNGAAFAWTLRMIIDTVAMTIMANKILPGLVQLKNTAWIIITSTLLIFASFQLPFLWLTLLAFFCISFFVYSYRKDLINAYAVMLGRVRGIYNPSSSSSYSSQDRQ